MFKNSLYKLLKIDQVTDIKLSIMGKMGQCLIFHSFLSVTCPIINICKIHFLGSSMSHDVYVTLNLTIFNFYLYMSLSKCLILDNLECWLKKQKPVLYTYSKMGIRVIVLSNRKFGALAHVNIHLPDLMWELETWWKNSSLDFYLFYWSEQSTNQ